MKFNQRILFSLLFCFLISSFLFSQKTIEEIKRDIITNLKPATNEDGNYNIIFITVDQQRYFREYPYGTNFRAREFLEEVGTTFENHYACANMSTSSRSVIYTGTHICDTKMIDNTDYPWQDALSEEIITVGDRLREAGFYTAYKGKYHMGEEGIFTDHSKPEMQKNNDLEPHGFSDWNLMGDLAGGNYEGYSDDSYVVGDAIRWLHSTGASLNNDGKSFFLAVNLVNPHDIMYFNTDKKGENVQWNENLSLEINRAPENKIYSNTYNDTGIPISWNEPIDAPGRVQAHMEYYLLWNRRVGTIPSEEERWERFRDYYYNCLQDSDNHLLNFLEELYNIGIYENTIIIFTSDHGEMMGAHGLRGKGGFMYDYNIHVPLIIYHPEYAGENRIEKLTSHFDMTTTFIDMTNISDERKDEISEGLAGNSILELINGEKEEIREGALFCFEMISMLDSGMKGKVNEKGEIIEMKIDFSKRGFVRGLITERYKFARYFSPFNFNMPETFEELFENNDVELFDLDNDPDEMINLAVEPEKYKELILELNNMLNEVIKREIGNDNGHTFNEVYESWNF